MVALGVPPHNSPCKRSFSEDSRQYRHKDNEAGRLAKAPVGRRRATQAPHAPQSLPTARPPGEING